jgi:hypothetical protein
MIFRGATQGNALWRSDRIPSVGIIPAGQRDTGNVCVRGQDEAKTLDLADEVDLFPTVPLGSVRMNSSLTISTHLIRNTSGCGTV